MATKGNSGELRTRSPISIFLVVGLCFSSYLLGSWQRSKLWKGDKIAEGVMNHTDCNILPNFNYERSGEAGILDDVTGFEVKEILPCDEMYIDHTPCQDHRGRHCNSDSEKLHCLIPAPKGYATPFPWPTSRHYVPYANVQSSMMHDGDVFRFPGNGADAYVNLISSLVPLDGGVVRTALDTGCGVANFGAYIIEKNVLTMSFAPRGSHEAQVQFALERGVPAVVGVLETFKLPYPSGAFDMAHCSSCLIPWGANDGMYMMEVDRVLRPGGYWILSGPPINWRRSKDDLKAERTKIEEIARLLCWEKKKDQLGTEIAIWQKSLDPDSCIEHLTMCESLNPNDVWYNKMEPCVTPSAKVDSSEWKSFPERLYAVPSRISSGAIPGVSPERYLDDSRIWKKHVNAYRRVNKILDTGRYRNVMDMNAGMGGFAAALESPKLWVMNVMPTAAEKDTLGVIYERGLIGIYHDWCEAFSTYPRTYDLIHANGVFSLYRDKCSMEDILLEMDRILRPEGTVIIRDEVGVLVKVKRTVSGMRWNTKMVDHEDGPTVPEKVMFAVKRYWVAGEQNGNHTN